MNDYDSCDACGILADQFTHDPRPGMDDGAVCLECCADWERAAQALSDGAWIHCRGTDGRIRPRAWIQKHDCQYALVSYARPELKDEWIELQTIEAVEEV